MGLQFDAPLRFAVEDISTGERFNSFAFMSSGMFKPSVQTYVVLKPRPQVANIPGHECVFDATSVTLPINLSFSSREITQLDSGRKELHILTVWGLAVALCQSYKKLSAWRVDLLAEETISVSELKATSVAHSFGAVGDIAMPPPRPPPEKKRKLSIEEQIEAAWMEQCEDDGDAKDTKAHYPLLFDLPSVRKGLRLDLVPEALN